MCIDKLVLPVVSCFCASFVIVVLSYGLYQCILLYASAVMYFYLLSLISESEKDEQNEWNHASNNK